MGYDYLGTQHPKIDKNFIEELNFEEQKNGKFKLIGDKVRE